MSRQYRNPMLVIKDTPVQLVEASGMKHEGWLQEFVFKHYQMLPIEETEPTFGPIIPVCRELNVNGNSLDLVFINEKGLLTLVECKLWQNPEARRTVIAQILDYAKDVSTWDYTALEDAVKKASGFKAGSLYELVKANTIDLDEKEFIDNVTRNLRRGRFLLLIIGNGIREGVERITEYLQAHAHLNFGFALVEYGIFRNPDVDDDSFYVQPRIIAQTVEIERAVVRIEDGKIIVVPVTKITDSHPVTITEQEFFEKLAIDAKDKGLLIELYKRARESGLYLQPGQNSMIVKYVGDYELTFGVFMAKGSFYNWGIASTTADLRQPQIGEEYLSRLAQLFPEGHVYKTATRAGWSAKIGQGRGSRYITISEILRVSDQWLALIMDTINKLEQARSSSG